MLAEGTATREIAGAYKTPLKMFLKCSILNSAYCFYKEVINDWMTIERFKSSFQ